MSGGCGDNLTVHDTLVFILFEMDGRGALHKESYTTHYSTLASLIRGA